MLCIRGLCWFTMDMMNDDQRFSIALLVSLGLSLIVCGLSIHFLLLFMEWWAALLSGLGVALLSFVAAFLGFEWFYRKKKS